MINVKRETKETKVYIKFNAYGSGKHKINTTIGFFNHLLSSFALHGDFNLYVNSQGDDQHHLVEDIGIALGEAIKKSFIKSKNINRFGNFLMPMDEVLCYVVVDISGRSHLEYDVEFPKKQTSGFELDLIKEFFRALVRGANITLHIHLKKSGNAHHIAESIFKGFGVALKQAFSVRKTKKILSLKGKI